MSAIRELPVLAMIGSAPPELVSRVAISCGYEWSQKKIRRSAGTASFDCNGGVLRGAVESDCLGQFPNSVSSMIAVDYHPSTGLPGFTKSLPDAAVTPAGVVLNYDVPFPLAKKIKIVLQTSMNATPPDTLNVSWQFIGNGTALKSEVVVVKGVGASVPDKPEISAEFFLHPEMTSQVIRIAVDAVGLLSSRPLEPFDQTFPVSGLQSVVLKRVDGTGNPPSTWKFTATTT